MAASSSNALRTITGGHAVVSEKLIRDNYMLWKAQVLPTVRGAQLMGYLDGTLEVPSKTVEIEKSDKTKQTIPNEAYSTWVAKDQQLLAFLLNSITKEVLPAVSTLGTSREV
jgi:hypothetical protein